MGALFACSGGGSTPGNLPNEAPPGSTRLTVDPSADTQSTARAGAIAAATTSDSCTSTMACVTGTNSSTGSGVKGISTNGRGVNGITKHNSTSPTDAMFGVVGQDASTSGTNDGGVFGTSVRGYGVRGQSSTGAGLYGNSTSGNGVFGLGQIGVYAQGADGVVAFGSGLGVYASSSGGDALDANTTAASHWAINAQSPNGSGMQLSAGSRGSDTTGGSIGVVARSTNFPLVAALPNGTDLFWIDSAGNVNYTGSLIQHAAAGASTVRTSSTQATTPAIEETGTARLVYGTAHVYFSSSLARSIVPRLGYQVFLTPGGDTRGLYVATKDAGGFTVREVQRGRDTLNFDYHVYARTAEPVNAQSQAAPVLPAVTQGMKVPSLPLGQPRQ